MSTLTLPARPAVDRRLETRRQWLGVLLCALPLLALTLLAQGTRPGDDWPTWRHDANRSGVSPRELPEKLHLQWVRQYPPLKPAWPDQPKMQLDAAYEPIILGKILVVGSSRHDCVFALDTATGAERWRFQADGPVRYAPLGWHNWIYFVSDDGHLYCLDAGTGALQWKVRGGPSDRRVLGNDRLISTWPARGAPVFVDGTIYFAASIWPFMGTFIHAVDARTGKVIWTNDGDGSIYIKQPHNADSFAGVAPQGYLVVQGDRLLVPGGRSIPAIYDRHTGKLLSYKLAENGKRGGGSDVAVGGRYFVNAGSFFDITTQKHLADYPRHLILTSEMAHAYERGQIKAYDLRAASVRQVKGFDSKGKPTTVTRWSPDEVACCETPTVETLIKAGTRVFGGGTGHITAVLFPTQAGERPSIVWQTKVEGTVVRLAAADNRLFAVTQEGRIYCFGGEKVEPRWYRPPGANATGLANTDATEFDPPLAPIRAWAGKAREVLETAGVREGYCIAWGIGSGNLLLELVRQSKLRIIAIDPDARKVQEFRNRLIELNVPGERLAVHHGDPMTFCLPPYLASLMVSEDLLQADIEPSRAFLNRLYPVLRPYGGVACLPVDGETARRLAQFEAPGARVRQVGNWLLLSREGPLPGAGNWTHEHADAANTRVSRDQLVKAPLGLLWFGGPSHDGILPRHGHGPQPQVIDGRLIIEGVDMLRAIDIYTGRLLWETQLPGVGRFYDNLAHQPGANASGGNYVSTADGIYVVHLQRCVKLDPANGKILSEFQLPPLDKDKKTPLWGYINVAGDYLVGGGEPLINDDLLKLLTKGTKPTAKPDDNLLTRLYKKLVSAGNDNLSSSKHLVVMNRHTGQVLWQKEARLGFRHNAICIGGSRLYAIDRLSGAQQGRLKRRGEEPPHPPRLVVLDLATGKELWSTENDVFGTWLSYSEKHDVLVEAGRIARDTLSDEAEGMRAYQANSGKVLWQDRDYDGPAMIHGDIILHGVTACDLRTGAPKDRTDPLTGQLVPWKWSRNYGCNTPMASEHLLTFRSGAAGYLDYCRDGGTGNLGGFRSGCTNSLVVAGGVLTAPDYTRTCTCAYQNQTSVGLVHMPEAEMWTFFGPGAPGPIKRLGLNLGAPGDRRADNGTLWIEYPSVAGKSPTVEVALTASRAAWFRRHSAQFRGPLPWVASSGIKGIEKLTITLDKGGNQRPFTIRLVFAEPDEIQAGQRIFSVALQGKTVLKDLDIVRETGGVRRSLVKEFKGVTAGATLELTFTTAPGTAIREAVLSGVEVVAEER